MEPTHREVVAATLETLADLDAHAGPLGKRGLDAEGAARKLTLLLLKMEQEDCPGCLPERTWADLQRRFSPSRRR